MRVRIGTTPVAISECAATNAQTVRTVSDMQKKMKAHLSPANLVGKRFPRDVFGNTTIALVGYCPPPSALENYTPARVSDQHFIHVTPDSVRTFSFGGINFLSLVHVYGGPVSASTVEELAYYGFDYILAYGLAGGMGTKGLRMGSFYLVDSALARDGTTPHYTKEETIYSDRLLKDRIMELAASSELKGITPVQAITGDAIYREDDIFLRKAVASGCDIVNLDSSHLFAVSRINSEDRVMRTIECGVISDVSGGEGDNWESTLAVMLSADRSSGINPLEMTGRILEFYIEQLAPNLLGQSNHPNTVLQPPRVKGQRS